MPVYEYVCRNCRKTFQIVETIARHEARKSVKCPKCSSRKVDRKYSTLYVETSRKS